MSKILPILLNHDTFQTKTLAGSSMEHLAQDAQEAVSALEEAILKVKATCPHPRDYIHAKFGTFKAATDQHNAIQDVLDELRDFYADKLDHFLNQSEK